MTQTIEQKSTLYDRDLNLWLEEAIGKNDRDLNLWLEEAIGKNLDFDMSI